MFADGHAPIAAQIGLEVALVVLALHYSSSKMVRRHARALLLLLSAERLHLFLLLLLLGCTPLLLFLLLRSAPLRLLLLRRSLLRRWLISAIVESGLLLLRLSVCLLSLLMLRRHLLTPVILHCSLLTIGLFSHSLPLRCDLLILRTTLSTGHPHNGVLHSALILGLLSEYWGTRSSLWSEQTGSRRSCLCYRQTLHAVVRWNHARPARCVRRRLIKPIYLRWFLPIWTGPDTSAVIMLLLEWGQLIGICRIVAEGIKHANSPVLDLPPVAPQYLLIAVP